MAAPTLLDAILRANQARSGGDASARADLPPGAMPFVITCMDPRLVGNIIPALGLEADPPPQAKFAGGVVRPGDVSGARSVLAAAVLNTATEVLVIGHTDCRMGKVSAADVRSGLARLGVRPEAFGAEDPAAWLGSFASPVQAVRSSVEVLRGDPRIPPAMPIHGLLFHLESRRMEVVVRGYEATSAGAATVAAVAPGYRPGPASLSSPPSTVYGAPGFAAPAAHPAGPVSLGAPGPITSGPVRFGAQGPSVQASSLGPPPPPIAPAGQMQPPSFPAPPSMAASAPAPPPISPPGTAQPSSFPETRPMADAAPPPAPPPAPGPLHPKGAKKRPRGASPFDRAQEMLDRMRRDRDG
jgi:carbonic anhydrase